MSVVRLTDEVPRLSRAKRSSGVTVYDVLHSGRDLQACKRALSDSSHSTPHVIQVDKLLKTDWDDTQTSLYCRQARSVAPGCGFCLLPSLTQRANTSEAGKRIVVRQQNAPL